MKISVSKQLLQLFVFLVVFCSLFVLSGCSNTNTSQDDQSPIIQENITDTNAYLIHESDFLNGEKIIKNIEEAELSKNEIDGLILMREEEKLARDVYFVLGEKWGVKIFSNISSSEQTHTNAVKVLLDRYHIEDPVKSDEIGIFTSKDLQKLYNQLVEQGKKSVLNALVVGITIEDLDINDLNKLIEKTDNADIIAVYNNLNRGSRNHLRAFMRQIDRNNGEYFPQYISKSEFDTIINSEQEKGGNR